jgi:hypothetical protein
MAATTSAMRESTPKPPARAGQRWRSPIAALAWLALLGAPSCALVGCGGAAIVSDSRSANVGAAPFLLEVGGTWSSALRRPSRSIDELETSRRAARSAAERRPIARELAIACVFAAEAAPESEARRLRRRGDEAAGAALAGNRDAQLAAEVDFVRLWLAWRGEARDAASRAARYTERHRENGALYTLAWMIRGELALGARRYEDALTAFRVALGQLESPLYAYALWRSATAYDRLGRTADAQQALRETEELGCPAAASRFTVRISVAVASSRGSGLRRDPDGITRPALCPPTGAPAPRSRTLD